MEPHMYGEPDFRLQKSHVRTRAASPMASALGSRRTRAVLRSSSLATPASYSRATTAASVKPMASSPAVCRFAEDSVSRPATRCDQRSSSTSTRATPHTSCMQQVIVNRLYPHKLFSISVANCGDPGQIIGGTRIGDVFTEGSSVTHTCDFCRTGGGTRTCLSSGAWTSPVQCTRKTPNSSVRFSGPRRAAKKVCVCVCVCVCAEFCLVF